MSNPTIERIIGSVPESEALVDVGSLMSHLSQLSDPRDARGIRYSLVTLLTLVILAKLGGEDKMKGIAEWVQLRAEPLIKLLKLSRESVPHQTTYERVLVGLDADELEDVVGSFFAQQTGRDKMVALDGKVLRGTIPEGETQGVHLLSAYAPEDGVVLRQVEVEPQTNELGMAPDLLQALDLRDCVVTGDAMFTHTDLCEQIVQAGGDYLLPVKANQKKVQQAIADVFMPAPITAGHSRVVLPETFVQTHNIGHGRIEHRYLTLSSQLHDYLDWPYLQQVFRLQRAVQHQKSGKLSYQVVFGVTSLSPHRQSAEHLMTLIRQHWHIENRLHYVRDVTFHEDACRIRDTKRQRVLAVLNNLVIGLIRRCDFDYVPEARRYFDANYVQAYQLLFQ